MGVSGNGAAMILGNLGRNLIVAHRRSIYRCPPEQLRFGNWVWANCCRILRQRAFGTKNLLEKGQFPRGQFTDLIPEDEPAKSWSGLRCSPQSGALTAAEKLQQQQTEESYMPDSAMPRPFVPTEFNWNSRQGWRWQIWSRACETYLQKTRTFWTTPYSTRPEEFLKWWTMSVTCPIHCHHLHLPHEAPEHSSPRDCGHKRSVSIREDSQEPPTHKPSMETAPMGCFVKRSCQRHQRVRLAQSLLYGSVSAERLKRSLLPLVYQNLNFSQRLTLPKLLTCSSGVDRKRSSRIAKHQDSSRLLHRITFRHHPKGWRRWAKSESTPLCSGSFGSRLWSQDQFRMLPQSNHEPI